MNPLDISRRDFIQSMFKELASPFAEGLAVAAGPAGPLLAVVDNARCSMGQGRDCDECVKACPVRPKAVSVSALGLSAGVNSARCTGCGACVAGCPSRAISLSRPGAR